DRTLQKLARKTCPGENKNMTNDGNQKAEAPESEDSQNLSGMAKAFLVSVAWSYAEALEVTKRSRNPQEAAPESPTESHTEQVDRNPESN
ncbi:MAG: hypothetical protein M3N42_05225, partial [Cyanobacteriota bacterium]|nr:hypothetical protein [Cyanobacteriota bacterium]